MKEVALNLLTVLIHDIRSLQGTNSTLTLSGLLSDLRQLREVTVLEKVAESIQCEFASKEYISDENSNALISLLEQSYGELEENLEKV